MFWRSRPLVALVPLLAVATLSGQVLGQMNPAVADDTARVAALKHKLASIIIEKLNFDKADLATVLGFLAEKSKELDPEKQGINFVLLTDPAAGTTAAAPVHAVSLTLDRISLADLLIELTEQTKMVYSIDPYAVFVHPVSVSDERLTVRTFYVPSGFFAGAHPDSTTTPEATQKLLESKGVQFPPGASATFVP